MHYFQRLAKKQRVGAAVRRKEGTTVYSVEQRRLVGAWTSGVCGAALCDSVVRKKGGGLRCKIHCRPV